jgi:hypothetical protein
VFSYCLSVWFFDKTVLLLVWFFLFVKETFGKFIIYPERKIDVELLAWKNYPSTFGQLM